MRCAWWMVRRPFDARIIDAEFNNCLSVSLSGNVELLTTEDAHPYLLLIDTPQVGRAAQEHIYYEKLYMCSLRGGERVVKVLQGRGSQFVSGSICCYIESDDIITRAPALFTEGYAFPTKFGDVYILYYAIYHVHWSACFATDTLSRSPTVAERPGQCLPCWSNSGNSCCLSA